MQFQNLGFPDHTQTSNHVNLKGLKPPKLVSEHVASCTVNRVTAMNSKGKFYEYFFCAISVF